MEDIKDKRKSRDLEKACKTLLISGTKLRSAPAKLGSKNVPMHEVKENYYDTLKKVRHATTLIPYYPTHNDMSLKVSIRGL